MYDDKVEKSDAQPSIKSFLVGDADSLAAFTSNSSHSRKGLQKNNHEDFHDFGRVHCCRLRRRG